MKFSFTFIGSLPLIFIDVDDRMDYICVIASRDSESHQLELGRYYNVDDIDDIDGLGS
jgi:hypothetical protein